MRDATRPMALQLTNCSGNGGPHHSAYVERVAEANLEDEH
jgi:hypothetical protein